MIRKDCKDGNRPCPVLRCKYHLIFSRSDFDIKMSDDEILELFDKMDYTCVLDVADSGACEQDIIAKALGTTQQRIHAILEGYRSRGVHYEGLVEKFQRKLRNAGVSAGGE